MTSDNLSDIYENTAEYPVLKHGDECSRDDAFSSVQTPPKAGKAPGLVISMELQTGDASLSLFSRSFGS
jgi:hypothetical protein